MSETKLLEVNIRYVEYVNRFQGTKLTNECEGEGCSRAV